MSLPNVLKASARVHVRLRVSCCGCISPTDDIRALQQSEGWGVGFGWCGGSGFPQKLSIVHTAATGHVRAPIGTIVKRSGPEKMLYCRGSFFSPHVETVPFFCEAAQTHRQPAHRLHVRRLLMSYGSQTLSEQCT